MVQMKNRVSGLLLETGVSHNKQRLHKVKYFRELLATNKEVDESIRPLLKLSRDSIERCRRPITLWSVRWNEILYWRNGYGTSGRFPEWGQSPHLHGLSRSEMYPAFTP
jgi:hypothetical protein